MRQRKAAAKAILLPAVTPLPPAEIPPSLLAAFEQRLLHEEFAVSTAQRYRRWVGNLYSNPDLHKVAPRCRTMASAAWSAFRAFHADAPTLISAPASSDRIRDARSLDRADWIRLRDYLGATFRENPLDACLLALALTGLRGVDLWRLSDADLTADLSRTPLRVLQKGGRYRYIKLLPEQLAVFQVIASGVKKTSSRNIAEWISGSARTESSPAAWHHLTARFIEIGAELGIPGRIHLHRLRRTLAVQVLKQTKDLHLVKELLGQSSIRSTEQYADEGRSDEVQAALGDVLKRDDL
jgi:hypothetical protein